MQQQQQQQQEELAESVIGCDRKKTGGVLVGLRD